MRKIELSDLKNIAEYEKLREQYRKEVIEAKKHRRVSVGPHLTFVFENRTTVLFQIQEMMRTERIVHDEAIRHEIETYNRLLPDENELAATLLVEIREKEQIRPVLDSLVGLNKESVYLVIGEDEVETIFDQEQASDTRISAVQYVRWKLSDTQIERMKLGAVEVAILVRHPNYQHFTQLTDEQRESVVRDLHTSDME